MQSIVCILRNRASLRKQIASGRSLCYCWPMFDVVINHGLFFDGTALPMVATIALCAAGAFTLSRITLRARAATS